VAFFLTCFDEVIARAETQKTKAVQDGVERWKNGPCVVHEDARLK
jgi:hypothetical protein